LAVGSSSSDEGSNASLQPSSSDSSSVDAVQGRPIMNVVSSSTQKDSRELATGNIGLFGLHHRHGRQHDRHGSSQHGRRDTNGSTQHHHKQRKHHDKQHHRRQPSRTFSLRTLQVQQHRGPQALAALARHGHRGVQRIHVSNRLSCKCTFACVAGVQW
jgi:hypothetical protein